MNPSRWLRRCWLAGGLLLIPLIVAAARLAFADSAQGPPSAQVADSVGGDFTLRDHRGGTYSLSQSRGQAVVLTFGYTYCPDICPTNLATLAAALRQLGGQADRVQPLFISLDPGRDTAARLGPYLAYFHPKLIGLTGSAEDLKRVADRYRVRYAFTGGGDRYTLDHTASIYVVDPQGRLARIVPYGLPADEIAEALRGVLADSGGDPSSAGVEGPP
jgi:protein SCO1/2